MADCIDVARLVLEKAGSVSTMKLQKLVFYSHAYSLVHRGIPLVPGHFEAWRNGPVLPELFQAHRGKFVLVPGELGEQSGTLCHQDIEIVDRVVDCLGDRTGRYLSEMTHQEAPWRDARGDLGPHESSSAIIDNEAIRSFYSGRVESNPLFQ